MAVVRASPPHVLLVSEQVADLGSVVSLSLLASMTRQAPVMISIVLERDLDFISVVDSWKQVKVLVERLEFGVGQLRGGDVQAAIDFVEVAGSGSSLGLRREGGPPLVWLLLSLVEHVLQVLLQSQAVPRLSIQSCSQVHALFAGLRAHQVWEACLVSRPDHVRLYRMLRIVVRSVRHRFELLLAGHHVVRDELVDDAPAHL